MKLNKYIVGTAAFTGLLCGLWCGFAGVFGLIAWSGFAGCYSFFALRSPSTDWKILALSILAGILLGFICDWGERMLFASWQPKKSKKKA